jgi:hypothetical protein
VGAGVAVLSLPQLTSPAPTASTQANNKGARLFKILVSSVQAVKQSRVAQASLQMV